MRASLRTTRTMKAPLRTVRAPMGTTRTLTSSEPSGPSSRCFISSGVHFKNNSSLRFIFLVSLGFIHRSLLLDIRSRVVGAHTHIRRLEREAVWLLGVRAHIIL